MSGALPRLHVVTDDAILARDGWHESAAAILEAGGPDVALQVRGPRTSGSVLYHLADRLVPWARTNRAHVVVNDRIDVALVTDVDGVHLGRRSLSVEHARRILGDRRTVGASLHGDDEAAAVQAQGADYAFVGTIFSTPTHLGVPGMGTDGLARAVARALGLPLLGIGGIDVGSVPDVVSAGAHGVAVVRGVWDHPDPAAAVVEYVKALASARR